MRITEHLESAKSTLFSFEVLPPVKGHDAQSIFDGIDPLMEFNPSFINITYHREEYIYKEHPNGLLEKRTVRKRPGTVGLAAAIMHKYKVDTVPHLICGGFTKEETEDALIDLHFLGVENVLVLRGDGIKTESNFMPTKGGHRYASELLEQVNNLNNGIYLDNILEEAKATNFCMGIAGYPEKHFEAPNMTTDLAYLKKKVDLGAEYIITQMFYNNEAYFQFVDKCRNLGINVPIIPGLKPLSTKRQLNVLPSIFHIDLPEDLVTEVENCKDNKAVKEIGIEWCIKQSKELIKAGVPCLHYYPMGKAQAVKRVATEIY
jgi:methylenetetrahydrofolate reductase (NADPH)